jgi:1-acyl-sn-glycerol-3-phosphate acyltransferase
MNPFRITWRFLQLLAHAIVGVYHSFAAKQYPTSNGESLPDPEWISAWARKLCRILHVTITHTGTPPHERALLISNHISWLDIPVIGALTHAGFLSKDSIRRWPLIGRLAVTAGTVFIKRGKGEAQQVAEAIATRLQGDRQLALFPEGTTSDGSSVGTFFPRLFAAAIDTDTQIIPVALRYSRLGKIDTQLAFTKDQSFFSVLLHLLGRKSSCVHVVFAEPIRPANRDRRSLSKASHDAIVTSLQQIDEKMPAISSCP